MAYIYRYQLRNAALRDTTSLVQYNQIIQEVLERHFDKNLKDSIIESRYFEFKLYKTAHRRLLQEMGRRLKEKLPINIDNYGFIRMEQALYALVYAPTGNLENNNSENRVDGDNVHIELIDSAILDKQESFALRAKNFFEKTRNTRIVNDREDVIKNYYIDILDAYVDKYAFSKKINLIKEVSCFFIKGFHRHIENGRDSVENQVINELLPLDNCYDIGTIINRNTDNEIVDARQSQTDYLKINAITEHPELLKKFEEELSLYIPHTDKIEALSMNLSDSKDKYEFRVHNVGQALATSLSYENEAPFLYFDYGMPFGKNAFTRPAMVNMPTTPGISIILSHVHRDHWNRIADDLNAYKCHWFIPDQVRKYQLNHKLAEVIAYGGSVQIIDSDLPFQAGRLTCGGCSKIRSSRVAEHIHETGMTLRLWAHDTNGEELNILIAGDQRYDYVEEDQLANLDILVATHHGGEYCQSINGSIPTSKNTENSIIIYSYGDKNLYEHPNTKEYVKANWIREHHTKDGEFKKSIYLYSHTEVGDLNLDGNIAHFSLTWINEPFDLDLHLYFRADGSNETHELSYKVNEIEDAQYDGDVTDGYGPENIHINMWHDGIYDLWVHNFSREPSFSQSRATIEFTIDGTPHAWQIKCPRDDGGNWWHVLRINTGARTVEFINRYDNTEDLRNT